MSQLAKKRYESMVSTREPFLRRARAAAAVTIPALMPPLGHNENAELDNPYQGLGARGVRNLASKLLLILMPPNTPFFKLGIDDFAIQQELDETGAREEVDKTLSTIERSATDDLAGTSVRVKLFELCKQLVVAGSGLLRMDEKTGGARMFTLNEFVMRRSTSGEIVELLTMETTSPLLLEDEVIAACNVTLKESDGNNKPVEIYTWVRRDNSKDQTTAKGGFWLVHQEINGKVVPGSDGSWAGDEFPYISPRMVAIDGEDYGRGYCDELMGDLTTFEGFSKHILEGAAAMAKMLIMRNPTGSVRAKDLEKPNLSIINGMAADVSVLRLDKGADFSVAQSQAQAIADRLQFAFLLNTAIQRNGDRVTAEEIRYMAGELEDALGGVYSVLSEELQLPLIKFQLWRMTKAGRLPKLPKGLVKPQIVTGLQALGRGQDLNKIRGFMQDLASVGGPEVLAKYVNIGNLINGLSAAWSINIEGLTKDEEEVGQADQQAMMMNMLQQAAPGLIQEMAKKQIPDTNKE